jgi:hypothetical protein
MSPRGYFCLSGVGTHDKGVCRKLGLDNLDGVPAELGTMRQTLLSLGLEEHLMFTTEERRHDWLARDLRNSDVPPGIETLVIYCTGHGIVEDTRFALLLPDGDTFSPTRLVTPFGNDKWTSLREIVLIVDACSAEPGLDAALAEARTVNTRTSLKGFWGIGASRRREKARQSTFANAFADVVKRSVRPSWTVSDLDPGALANEVNKAVGPAQNVWLADGHPAEPCTALPNPCHQNPVPPRGLLPLPADWAARARGVADANLPGFFFTGRTTLLSDLRTHLTSDDDEPVVVVTGRRAAGKSALLGHLVLTSHEAGRRALPGEVRTAWPELPVLPVAGRGDPSQVTGMLFRGLAGTGDLEDILQLAPKPLGVVLDDLDETADPEEWARLFATLRSVPGVRVVVGMPASSPVCLAGSARIHDLDDLAVQSADEVREYLRKQFRLAVPNAGDIDRELDALAPRAGAEWEVAVSVTLRRVTDGEASVNGYRARAARELDAAAHRVCRERVGAMLGEKARGIVSALSALCGCGEAVALPAPEWAAAASPPGGPRVDTEDVVLAAQLMRSLVEARPAADGTPLWRARFGHPEGGGLPTPEEFLQRLPQVTGWQTVNWREVNPGVLELVSRAAALGLIPGRLIDDPAFLLGVPPEVASKALQQLDGNRGDRARRSRMWRLVPRNAPDADRAFLLRIGAERFDVKSLVHSFRTFRGAEPSPGVDWVQPDRARTTRLTGMTATAAGPHAAVVTMHDDNTLAFWNPVDGSNLRSPVSVLGAPRDVTAAVVEDRPVALVSTWQHGIWRVPCDEDTAPTPLQELAPPRAGGDDGIRLIPLLLTLHPSGVVVVAAGTDVWIGRLDTGAALRRLATTDSELLAVRTAGPLEAPVAWLVPASGRVRRLRLGEVPGPAMSPFPVPQRPLAVTVSEAGDQALIVDVGGGLHLRGAGRESTALTAPRNAETRVVALDDATVVVGGSAGHSAGWLDIRRWARPAAISRLPLDDAAVEIALQGKDRLLVARACGLLSLNLAGRHD